MNEHPENAWQHIRGDPQAIVLHPDRNFVSDPFRAQQNLPALGRVLGRIIQQIGDDLRQSSRVAVGVQSLPCLHHRKFMALCMNKRLGGLNGVRDNFRQRHPLPPQLHLASGNPRHVQQIINQTDQVAGLFLHHVENLLGLFPVRRQDSQNVNPIADWCQRVSEFMGEHRQELVLEAGFVGKLFRLLLQLPLHPYMLS